VEDRAYYGYDTELTAKPNNGGAVFGLELGWPDDLRRSVRIVADYPKQLVSGAPTAIRLDITPQAAQLVRSAPAGTLVCL
jgi:hypothetical protein